MFRLTSSLWNLITTTISYNHITLYRHSHTLLMKLLWHEITWWDASQNVLPFLYRTGIIHWLHQQIVYNALSYDAEHMHAPVSTCEKPTEHNNFKPKQLQLYNSSALVDSKITTRQDAVLSQISRLMAECYIKCLLMEKNCLELSVDKRRPYAHGGHFSLTSHSGWEAPMLYCFVHAVWTQGIWQIINISPLPCL